jgi:hypothetical protein
MQEEWEWEGKGGRRGGEQRDRRGAFTRERAARAMGKQTSEAAAAVTRARARVCARARARVTVCRPSRRSRSAASVYYYSKTRHEGGTAGTRRGGRGGTWGDARDSGKGRRASVDDDGLARAGEEFRNRGV